MLIEKLNKVKKMIEGAIGRLREVKERAKVINSDDLIKRFNSSIELLKGIHSPAELDLFKLKKHIK